MAKNYEYKKATIADIDELVRWIVNTFSDKFF